MTATTTTVTLTGTLTGTGVPHVGPGRAGPGVLVRHGETTLQFDAGRATVLRLVEAGSACHELDAVFLTHVHSDHVIDIAVRVEHVQPAGAELLIRGFELPSAPTRVCDEMREFARDADVLVHEACRATSLAPFIAGTPFEDIFDYHADPLPLGRLAAEADVRHLVLTHLIPVPANAEDEAGFADDIRAGGYAGRLTVGHDLFTVDLS